MGGVEKANEVEILPSLKGPEGKGIPTGSSARRGYLRWVPDTTPTIDMA
jgi:hypothetical protein